jgi:uroporphyrinogen-III decarboxylase
MSKVTEAMIPPMTPRERLFAALEGKPTDKLPIWLLFPYHQIGCYVDVRTHPDYREIFEYSKNKVIMLNRRSPRVPLFKPGFDPELDHPIGSEEELDRILKLPLQDDEKEINALLEEQWPQYAAEKAEFPTDYGAMMLALGEPINWLYGNSDMQEYAIWSLTRSREIVEFLDRIYKRQEIIYRFFLDRDAADVYFLVGSELAAPPMVSNETFYKWIVPYAKGLTDLIHSYGKKVIQHFHGQIATLLDDFVEMGADAVHTIEAPPIGNCTFTQAFERVGDKMALIGNIQYDDFRALSQEEMKKAVEDVIEECRGKRLILSPSAGPFDENLSEHMKKNYLTFIKTAWESEDWK